MLLRVENLEAGYGELHVVRDVTFEVKEKELVCLLGSNGAGKTTTLKAISGIIPPQVFKGRIIFAGEDITHIAPHERVEKGLVHVPEGRGIFPDLTVYENLKIATYTKRAREHFEDSLEIVYNIFPILKERKNQRAGTLSGGEQQMLAIARGLMQRPKIIMLDEPSLGLAPKIVLNLFKLIAKLKDQGYTILLVEQNVKAALSIASYGYVMESGKVVLDGPSDKLKDNEDIKEFYLGLSGLGQKKSYKEVKHYKRRKRWLS